MLQDSDTRVLLATVRERGDPLSWFRGDWPLLNHFYRPVSTLTFELDNALWRDWAPGYGWTNAIVCALGVIALFWVIREMTDKSWLAGLSASIFGLWNVNGSSLELLKPVLYILAGVALVGFFRRNPVASVLAVLSLVFLATQLSPPEEFGWRVLGWLPGRTTSTMTLFALASVGAFSRYARLCGIRSVPVATPTDIPATRGTQVAEKPKHGWIWLLVSLLSLALALGCHEQAVVVPGVLTATWLAFRLKGIQLPGWLVGLFWALLAAYALVRGACVPFVASGYQRQQFRNGGGVGLALADYFLPATVWWPILRDSLAAGLELLVTLGPWLLLGQILGNIVQWKLVVTTKERWDLIWAYAASAGSFLPMAWLKPFGHYHELPCAFRAVFVVLLLTVGFRAWASAVSPRALRAPARPSPAPGSLHRP
jgi:hypothetical protein